MFVRHATSPVRAVLDRITIKGMESFMVGNTVSHSLLYSAPLTHWPLKFNEILVIFKPILLIDGWGISCEIAFWWMSLVLTLTLIKVMAWCHQAPSHYLNQRWPRYISPHASLGHNEKDSVTKVVLATGHQVCCTLWEQVVIFNKGIGF